MQQNSKKFRLQRLITTIILTYMRKQLLSLCLVMLSTGMAWADDTQTVTIDGRDIAKTVKKITFSGDDVILHYADGSTESATDMELVKITFTPSSTGILKSNVALDAKAEWYDLSGRRLNGVPTVSGTYIKRTTSKTIKVQK